MRCNRCNKCFMGEVASGCPDSRCRDALQCI
ncbi:hypothetical protein DRQ05_01460 [bacterium]|nr:MAG: hypothetical protein DRQ05_01460 [bacterium]